MRVILLQNVPKVGQKSEIKEVSSGYATNLLFPRGLAEIATPAKIAALEKSAKARAGEMQVQSDLLQKDLKKLSGITVALEASSNEKGHLFKGVHVEEIIEALARQHDINLPSESLVLEHPIKEVGEHTIVVQAGGGKHSLALEIQKSQQ